MLKPFRVTKTIRYIYIFFSFLGPKILASARRHY